MPSPTLTTGEIRELSDCICFNLRWVNRLLTQRYDAALRPTGLRVTQLPILARLAAGSVAMAELADWLGMDRTTLLRNLRPLIRDGYVTTARVAGQRAQHCTLTSAGSSALGRAKPRWAEAQAAVAATLGAKRWRTLLADLAHATERLATT